ncbi:PAS domain-containing sensor histidine kinase [Myxococcaceae bacterium GXIMD 01537]
MKKPSEPPDGWDSQRDEIIGLGKRSIRKSYFGTLQERLSELARFRSLLDESSDAIIVAELPGFRVVDVNRAGRRMLDPSGTAPTGLQLQALFGPSEWRKLEAYVHEGRDGEAPAREPGLLTLQGEGGERIFELSMRQDTFGHQRYLLLVARDVTERVKAEQALRAAKEEAEAAARAKARFLSVASHELRTPLTSLMLLLQQALRRAEHAPSGRYTLDRMLRQASRLATLVDDLLDVSRLDHDQLVLRPTPIELRSLVREVVEDFRVRAPDRHFQLELPAEPTRVEVDPTRVTQVLSNLLENAIKYSPAGSPVGVHLALEEGLARVSVSDQGPGIPEEERGRLFKPFERLGGPGKDSPGLGLGLYLSRQLVERHGGQLRAEPTGNKGATFSFILPLDGGRGEAREGVSSA